ncbi:uncharacterized protein LOC109504400 [Harpegnathos saltator]|uniref:uncharacterized protein LOC109504400 n=1 Tax=Harpegnathos saltator TaxID=610380 RepID=UPI000DBEE4DB|nr:uncharacterized protein LOC109504400 [Harpegnathos saltator]
MRKACIVPGCTLSAKTPIHKFPKDPGERLSWLESIKIKDIEHVISNLRHQVCVCYKHFHEEDYIYSLTRRKLKDDATPCINIPSRIKCIAANSNIDSEDMEISACNVEFCPDSVTLEPLQLGFERYQTYILYRRA